MLQNENRTVCPVAESVGNSGQALFPQSFCNTGAPFSDRRRLGQRSETRFITSTGGCDSHSCNQFNAPSPQAIILGTAGINQRGRQSYRGCRTVTRQLYGGSSSSRVKLLPPPLLCDGYAAVDSVSPAVTSGRRVWLNPPQSVRTVRATASVSSRFSHRGASRAQNCNAYLGGSSTGCLSLRSRCIATLPQPCYPYRCGRTYFNRIRPLNLAIPSRNLGNAAGSACVLSQVGAE